MTCLARARTGSRSSDMRNSRAAERRIGSRRDAPAASMRHEGRETELQAMSPYFAGQARIVIPCSSDLLRPGAVGEVWRRRLVARRRLGQGFPVGSPLNGAVSVLLPPNRLPSRRCKPSCDGLRIGLLPDCRGCVRIAAGPGRAGSLAGREFARRQDAAALRIGILACLSCAAAIAALRRCIVGILRPIRRLASAAAAAGGGRSSLGGTTSGDRSR